MPIQNHVIPIIPPEECCPLYLGDVCWVDGGSSGRAFAIRLADGSLNYIDQATGNVVAQINIVTCQEDQGWTALTTGTLTMTVATANGNVAAGAASVTITNVGTADATVAGAALKPGQTITVNAYEDPVARQFVRVPAIAYTASATAILHVTRQG